METKATGVVLFADRLGGGYIEPEDYIIVEYCDWNNVDETLLLKNY